MASVEKKSGLFNKKKEKNIKKKKGEGDVTPEVAGKNYQKPLKGKGKKRPSDGDDTWEQAVKKARGLPDGESDGSTLSVKSKTASVKSDKSEGKTNKVLKVYSYSVKI